MSAVSASKTAFRILFMQTDSYLFFADPTGICKEDFNIFKEIIKAASAQCA
jgi:hypothetical protein